MARAVILAYHAIDDYRANVSVPPTAFRQQMRWLNNHGYECVTVSELLRRSTRNKVVALTFDDGFRSTHSTALPILKEYSYTATCFPISEAIGKSTAWHVGGIPMPTYELMSPSELSELAAEGWEIGSHTTRHDCCVQRAEADVHADLTRARHHLQDKFGLPIRGFAYPQGCRDEAAERLVAEVGHTWAVSTCPGTTRGNFNPFAVRRVTIGNSTSFTRFLAATVEPVQAARRAYYARSERPYRPHVHPSDVHTTDFA